MILTNNQISYEDPKILIEQIKENVFLMDSETRKKAINTICYFQSIFSELTGTTTYLLTGEPGFSIRNVYSKLGRNIYLECFFLDNEKEFEFYLSAIQYMKGLVGYYGNQEQISSKLKDFISN